MVKQCIIVLIVAVNAQTYLQNIAFNSIRKIKGEAPRGTGRSKKF